MQFCKYFFVLKKLEPIEIFIAINMQKLLFIIFLSIPTAVFSQIETSVDSSNASTINENKQSFLKALGNGFIPIGPFDLDLRYLIKFNQYEGFRTGLGGITNKKLSEYFRLYGYGVYGFKDKRYKYNFGGGVRVNKATSTWVDASYTDDLQETGSSNFLSDQRFFSFFEPRLININLFHRHITQSVSVEHKPSKDLLVVGQFSNSNISPTYTYTYLTDEASFTKFNITTAKISVQWSPFSTYSVNKYDAVTEDKIGYPKFTLQYSRGFKSVFDSDFAYHKIDFRTVYQKTYHNKSFTNITLVAGYVDGSLPLTHLYHAYPNNINKQTVLQRFSVAGLNSFETMFFNEFFSDRFSTLQIKHAFKPFDISNQFKPQLVLISRHAIGDMNSIDRHQGIVFNTLEKIYSESGFEINKLFLGFGLSFAYRHGAYHLEKIDDNIALKFTFNITL